MNILPVSKDCAVIHLWGLVREEGDKTDKLKLHKYNADSDQSLTSQNTAWSANSF